MNSHKHSNFAQRSHNRRQTWQERLTPNPRALWVNSVKPGQAKSDKQKISSPAPAPEEVLIENESSASFYDQLDRINENLL